MSGAARAAGNPESRDTFLPADALPAKPATGNGACANLPRSALELYDLHAAPLHRVVVDVPDRRTRGGGQPRHGHRPYPAAMVITGHFVTLVNVEHQVIRAPTGTGYCDSPVKVRIGYATRQLYLTQAAANDDCVQNVLMAHAAKHAQAEDDLLGRFLLDEEHWFGRHLAALKRTSAPTAVAVQERFMAGSIALVREARQRFLASTAALLASTVALKGKLGEPGEMLRLNAARGGRVGQIELQLHQSIRGTTPCGFFG